jgi:hypothetical protein
MIFHPRLSRAWCLSGQLISEYPFVADDDWSPDEGYMDQLVDLKDGRVVLAEDNHEFQIVDPVRQPIEVLDSRAPAHRIEYDESRRLLKAAAIDGRLAAYDVATKAKVFDGSGQVLVG